MKHIDIIISATIVLSAIFASCSKDESASKYEASGKIYTLEATIADAGASSPGKTVIQSDGTVFWSPNDTVSLFYGCGSNGGSRFVSTNTESSQIVNFSGYIETLTGGVEVEPEKMLFWGVYPYSKVVSCDGNVVTMVLPSNQVSAEGTFSKGQFPTMGRSEGLSMAFYNICGGIRFTVSKEDINAVVFKARGGESIAGTAIVSFDKNGKPFIVNMPGGPCNVTVTPEKGNTFVAGKSYYAVIPPVTLSKGMDVTYLSKNQEGTYSNTGIIEINRSMFKTLLGKDQGLEWKLGKGNVPFKDAAFKSYCVENFDIDGDREISYQEALLPTAMTFCTDSISSIDGIKYFENLKLLSASGSGGITCYGQDYYVYGGRIGGLELPSADNINVRGNLTSVDLSGMDNLDSLCISFNPLKDINLDNVGSLRGLDIEFCGLSSIDVSKLDKLESFNCSNNFLTSLNVSNNGNLRYLFCGVNYLSSLNIDSNDALIFLNCGQNQLLSMDISNNTSLTSLYCYYNRLSGIYCNRKSPLKCLEIYNNQLTNIDLSKYPALEELALGDNQLTSLDISANTSLLYLQCERNQIRALDFANNTKLQSVYCYNNQLVSLDLSALTALERLYCYNNKLTSLDINHNVSLKRLNCYGNQLKTLNVNKNTLLSYLDCAPMNDAEGKNLLLTLFIYDGQRINRITTGRNNNYIPEETVIQTGTGGTGRNEDVDFEDWD